MKRVVKALLGLVVVVVVLAVTAVGLATRELNARRNKIWNVEGPTLSIPYGDPAALARGEHLANAVSACVECHDRDFGGRTFLDDGALGVFVGPNLTTGRGGRGARLGEADWSRAITRGVGDSHRSLLIMPARDFQNLSNDDIAAIIAYARTRPAVDRDPGSSEVRPFGRVLFWLGKVPILLSAEDVQATQGAVANVAPGRTVEYGRYLAGACVGCHRNDYNGGPMTGAPPDSPPPANLTPTGLPGYTEAEFVRAIREGKARDGHTINTFMPWRVFANMTDDELGALYLFIKALPPKPTGQ